MNDLRVPTTSLSVEIRCADGRRFVGDIFMPAHSSRQAGPMRPDEWAETVHRFFPFRPFDTPCRTIFHRDAVVSISVPATANESDVDTDLGCPVFRVAIDAAEQRFEGDVIIDMPPNQQRVVDWLNAPGPFVTIRDGATHHLVHKQYITRVVEMRNEA